MMMSERISLRYLRRRPNARGFSSYTVEFTSVGRRVSLQQRYSFTVFFLTPVLVGLVVVVRTV
jgi:hypothetical protein